MPIGPNMALPFMKIRIRFLIVAVLLWHHLSAPAVTVTERLQWNDAQQTANLPPTGDALWHTAGKAVDRGWESGTLWLRMRVQAQAQEDLYLALRHVNVDDLAVGVQLPTSSVDAAVAPPASLQAVDAHDVQAGKLLLRADHSGPQEVIVWIRARGAQVRWFEADVVGSDVLMQQRASDAAITAMQLTFSALLLLVSLALWSQSRKPVFAGMGGLGLLSMLFQLQCSGSFIAALGQDLQAYVRLNNALALVLGCAGLYASAAVVASPRFRLRYQSALHAALAASVLLTLVAYLSGYRSLNLVAAALLSLALYGFCGDCLRHWWQHRNWRQGWGNRLLSAVFLLMVLANLDLLSHLFVPSLDLPWVDAWRPLTMPLLSWSLLLTLLWRQYRSHAVQERRRHVNLQKLQEQISIRFLQQQFIAMLVHEIKTPLTVVQLGTHALLKNDMSPERKQAWNLRMHTAIKSIVHILDNCSQAERYEGGVMVVSPVIFSVAEILDVVKLLALDHANDTPDRLQLRCDGPVDGLQVHTDPSYFQIIFNNLVGNALKYSKPDCAVVVQLSRFTDVQGQPMVQFAVRSVMGPWGAPDPEKVFSRYYRSDKAGSVSGTGLGLWLSQKLAERLDTRIHLSLEAGQVVFWFTLPLVHEAGQALTLAHTGSSA